MRNLLTFAQQKLDEYIRELETKDAQVQMLFGSIDWERLRRQKATQPQFVPLRFRECRSLVEQRVTQQRQTAG